MSSEWTWKTAVTGFTPPEGSWLVSEADDQTDWIGGSLEITPEYHEDTKARIARLVRYKGHPVVDGPKLVKQMASVSNAPNEKTAKARWEVFEFYLNGMLEDLALAEFDRDDPADADDMEFFELEESP